LGDAEFGTIGTKKRLNGEQNRGMSILTKKQWAAEAAQL
jgi:hypothetical protein